MEATIAEGESRAKQMQAELDMWRDKYRQLERDKGDVDEQLRVSHDHLKVLSAKAAPRVSGDSEHLAHQLQAYRDQLDTLLTENDAWRRRALAAENEGVQAQSKRDELETRVQLLTAEINRLYGLLGDSEAEKAALAKQ